MEDYGKYRRTYQDFKRTLNITAGRNTDDEFEKFCLGAVFRTWGRNGMLYSDDYKKILEGIFEKEYTREEIERSMLLYSGNDKTIAVPGFFKDIVDADRARRTDNAKSALDALYEFLALIALLNGDFTMEEASSITEIINRLKDYAVEKGMIIDRPIPEFPKSITGRTGSYSINGDTSETWKPELVLGDEQIISFNKNKVKNTDDLLTFLNGDNSMTDILKKEMGLSGIGSGSAGSMNNAAGAQDIKTAASSGNPAQAEDAEELPEKSDEKFNELMNELNELVGLTKVKEDIKTLMNFIKINNMRQERGMKKPKISYHLVFTGNPGTGKTTVARLIAGLYYQMGILPKGQLIETDRSMLVAGYLGQTAIKTQEVIDKAMGGVLFIDEAYSLANDDQDSYGKEAIETILKAMEDHRDELVVIVAGYTDLMHKFINSNPGLNSRFNKYFLFPDYTGPELKGIFDVYCKKNGYKITEETGAELEKRFSDMYENRTNNFGNGRDVRNIFEKAINNQANRLAAMENVTDEELQLISMEDIEKAMEHDEARPEAKTEEDKLEDMLKALKESSSTD